MIRERADRPFPCMSVYRGETNHSSVFSSVLVLLRVVFLALGASSPSVSSVLAAFFAAGFFAAGGVLQLVTAVANEMFPKNRGVITSIVMIASSAANYIGVSIAGVLTRVGGTEGPRLVLVFNMAVTLVGIVLALYLNTRIDKDSGRE